MSHVVVKLENVVKTYFMGDNQVQALRGISFEIQEGEFTAIMGPSGSGKSTCMNMIGCLDRPSSGIVKVDGKETALMSEKELAYLLFPERAKAGDGYLIPDFKWEEFQMVKHRSSIRLCWRRYCKRAAKQNLAAYSWKVFLTSYNDYRRPKIQVDDPDDKIRTKLKNYNFLSAYCESDKVMYSVIQTEKEMEL